MLYLRYLARLGICLCIYLQLCGACYQYLEIRDEAYTDMTSLSKFSNFKQFLFKGCLSNIMISGIVIRNLSRYPADSIELPPWLKLKLITTGFWIILRRAAVPNHLLKCLFFCFSLIFLLFVQKRNSYKF